MRIVIGVSGASGVVMAQYLLQALRRIEDCEIHLVITKGARDTWELESEVPIFSLERLADIVHSDSNLAASISSGSFVTDGVIVIPCSMKTLSAIASGYSANLLVRAVDVCLKEGRRVVLVPREMPLSKVHLRNLKEAAELGYTIIPPMLTFYNTSNTHGTLFGQINHVVGKILMQFGLQHNDFVPWEGVSHNGTTISSR